jgi:tRNA-(ms[2]io[6]A)-hydroxylase
MRAAAGRLVGGVLGLSSTTSDAWFLLVQDHVDVLLLDHAHNEQKAASTAISLMFRYQDDARLQRELSELAREELTHFEQVLALLVARGVPFRRLTPAPYAAALYRHVRSEEPSRLLDTLLACALIEARSCERMKVLSERLGDRELRAMYAGLLASEARHYRTYTDLARDRFGGYDHQAPRRAGPPRSRRAHHAPPGAQDARLNGRKASVTAAASPS